MKKSCLVLISIVLISSTNAKTIKIQSPDNNLQVSIRNNKQITYSVLYHDKAIINSSPVSLTVNGENICKRPELKNSNIEIVDTVIINKFGIQKELHNHYKELTLNFSGNLSMKWRIYNNGVAYRFLTSYSSPITINREKASFNASKDSKIIYAGHKSESLQTSFEAAYEFDTISQVEKGYFTWLPVMIKRSDDIKVLITETDVLDYPGMFLEVNKNLSLRGKFAAYPLKSEPGGFRNFNLKVKERADYIAKTEGTRSFPWRLIIVEDKDIDLVENQLVYLLSSPSEINDISWIKPGQVAWDWWNNLNLDNVDFRTGVNTKTYEYFIDFAANNGIPYVNLDEGWSDRFDLLKINPDIDLPHLSMYAKERNVRLILWCVWHTLDKQMEEAMDYFQKLDIAGLKIDFIDRNDQVALNFYERSAQEAAKRKMFVNYHGAMNPTGLYRTYPNILSKEGVLGMEYNKFGKEERGVKTSHNVTIPYIRNVAGPMDYTPGAMRNIREKWYRPIFSKPMSPGTRSHQVAMYIVYFSPLQMLSDAPTAYEKEKPILQFITHTPTVWDETIGLEGEVGEYTVIARRKKHNWWIGGMNNQQAREVSVPLTFLNKDAFYQAIIIRDGINSDRNPTDYKKLIKNVSQKDVLKFKMSPGGGFAIRIALKQIAI